MRESPQGRGQQIQRDRFGFLASKAAVQLDNCKLGVSKDLSAVHAFRELLLENAGRPGESTVQSFLSPVMASIFGTAFHGKLGERPNLQKVDLAYHELTARMADVSVKNSAAELESLRDACVALARSAHSYKETHMHAGEPGFTHERR
jgi:hypothetical protein